MELIQLAIRIPLGGGYFTRVSVEDYHNVRKLRWGIHRDKHGNVYAIHRPRPVPMHRIIFGGERPDHIDRDRLNNTRQNLRSATRSQNAVNSKKRRGTHTSRFKGVTWHKRDLKWMARLMVDGHRIQLGMFDDELEAARAYDVAAKAQFGDYAVLNLPA